MKVKKTRNTIDIKFENRPETIAFMRAMGANNIANQLQAVEDREQERLAQANPPINQLAAKAEGFDDTGYFAILDAPAPDVRPNARRIYWMGPEPYPTHAAALAAAQLQLQTMKDRLKPTQLELAPETEPTPNE